MNRLEVGTRYDCLTRCPVCDRREGFEEIDGMGTSRCSYCGSRFLQTPFGVEYVGPWETYACKEMYSLPRGWEEVKLEELKQKLEAGK